jgi:hypothetical protein
MKISFAVRIYLLAMVLRLIPVLLAHNLGIGLDDMFQYDMLARSLSSGNGYRWYAQQDLQMLTSYIKFDLSTAKGYDPEHGLYTSFRAPLYPVFLALIYFFGGTGFSRFFIARLVQAIMLGAPLAPLTYFISAEFLRAKTEDATAKNKDRISKISAVIVACYPMLVIYPLGLATENLFFLLLLLSFLLLLRCINNPTTLNLILTGIFLGLASLTRSVILPFSIAALVLLMFIHHKKAVFAVCALLLVITPWIVRNSILHHELTGIETSMGYNLYLGYYPKGNGSFIFGPSLDLLTIMDDAQRDRVGTQKAVGFISQSPGRFVPLLVNRIGFFFGLEKRVLMYFYSSDILGYISKPILLAIALAMLLPFICISVSASLGFSLLKWNLQTALLFLLFIFYLLPHALILSEDRFHLALIPLFAILAARFWTEGLRSILYRWHESNSGRLLVAFSIICIFLLFLNWGLELSRDADKIALLLGPNGNRTYFPY